MGHSTPLPTFLLGIIATFLLSVGIWFDSWWIIAGGVSAGAGMGWLVTER